MQRNLYYLLAISILAYGVITHFGLRDDPTEGTAIPTQMTGMADAALSNKEETGLSAEPTSCMC